LLVALLVALPLVAPSLARAEDAPAAPSSDLLASRVVLARFSTSYLTDVDHKARATNVELAAEAIHGRRIPPGGGFSFNDAVGERTAAFGYEKSVVLRDGMIAEGTGGGACQVASTLHAAALLAGLVVVSRAPHSRPSAYIRMGLDATVAMQPGATIDLKLKNLGPHAVVIRARASRGALLVSLEADGGARPEVTVTSEILETTLPGRLLERDSRAAADVVRKRAIGIPGFRVQRTREVRAADGSVRRDVRIDLYPPTPEVLVVAPSFDASRLERGSLDRIEPVVDEGVARPARVQLVPSTRVVLRNDDDAR
jgi:hypothetical protein